MENSRIDPNSFNKGISLEQQILILQGNCEKQFLLIEKQNKIIKKFIEQQYRSQNIISKLLSNY